MANIGRNANNALNETVKQLKTKVITLLERGRLEDALVIIKRYIADFDTRLGEEVSNNIRILNNVKIEKRKMIINSENYEIKLTQISYNIQEILREIIKEISEFSPTKTIVAPELSSSIEEKIIGKNDLIRIAFLQKVLKAARSVCRVVAPNSIGSGFVIKGGLLITNNHVIRSEGRAANTRIEFNYTEQDISKVVTYKLDNSIFFTDKKLDVTIVKIKDNSEQPLSNWGYLKLVPDYIPKVDEQVNIIQHPGGDVMQVSLVDNEVLAIRNQYIYYKTDTKAGSSGSPVFNENWDVVALHHAGSLVEKDENDFYIKGGFRFTPNGERTSSNRGILMKYIFPHIPSVKNEIPNDPEGANEAQEKKEQMGNKTYNIGSIGTANFADTIINKNETSKKTAESQDKTVMDWEQLNDWIDEGLLSNLFKKLNEIYDQMGSRKRTYNRFKRQYENDKIDLDFEERLKTFLGSLESQID